MNIKILKENMRRFGTKNLNEANIKQIAQQLGIDLNKLPSSDKLKHPDYQNKQVNTEQYNTGDMTFNAVMESIQDALTRQGFGILDYENNMGYVTTYPKTELDYTKSTLWCIVKPYNYARWIGGEFKILPLQELTGDNMVEITYLGLLVKEDLITDDFKPIQNSGFEKALIEMKSKYVDNTDNTVGEDI